MEFSNEDISFTLSSEEVFLLISLLDSRAESLIRDLTYHSYDSARKTLFHELSLVHDLSKKLMKVGYFDANKS